MTAAAVADTSVPAAEQLPNLGGLTAGEAEAHPRGLRNWFGRLLALYMRRHYEALDARSADERARIAVRAAAAGTETTRSHRAIRRACVKSAAVGGSAALISTGATVLTAETEGLATIVTLPTTLATLGGELAARALLHLSLTFQLADIFEVRFDPDDPQDLWRLYALAFGTHQHENDEDPGKALVEKVVHVQGHEVGEQIGAKLLGQTVARTIVPFVGIATSTFGSWRSTQRFGDTVRRYVRYRRALRDAFEHAGEVCAAQLDLLVEGLWFIFTADGQLNPEEAAVLAGHLKRFDPVMRARVTSRFVEDELDWLERLPTIPEGLRDPFLHALEVAAAVDKIVSLPERKILRHAAHALGREFDPARLKAMVDTFEEVGVLPDEPAPRAR